MFDDGIGFSILVPETSVCVKFKVQVMSHRFSKLMRIGGNGVDILPVVLCRVPKALLFYVLKDRIVPWTDHVSSIK